LGSIVIPFFSQVTWKMWASQAQTEEPRPLEDWWVGAGESEKAEARMRGRTSPARRKRTGRLRRSLRLSIALLLKGGSRTAETPAEPAA
jgi:hypothetical protein